jgi:hypothetical protein
MNRRIECGGMQGHGNPYATRRVMVREFDSLRDRMQEQREQSEPYSKWRAVVAVLFTIVAVLFIVVLNLPSKGHP